MIRRIAVTGPESSGKSTLAAALARALDAPLVSEFARSYLSGLPRPYVQSDLLEIALGQALLESEAALKAPHWMVCDTDFTVLRIWSEVSYGTCDPAILKLAAAHRYDLVIIAAPDFPWQFDPLREHPADSDRQWLFRQYVSSFLFAAHPVLIAAGDPEARLQRALSAARGIILPDRSL